MIATSPLFAETVEGLGAYCVPPVGAVWADAAGAVAVTANASTARTRTGLGVIEFFLRRLRGELTGSRRESSATTGTPVDSPPRSAPPGGIATVPPLAAKEPRGDSAAGKLAKSARSWVRYGRGNRSSVRLSSWLPTVMPIWASSPAAWMAVVTSSVPRGGPPLERGRVLSRRSGCSRLGEPARIGRGRLGAAAAAPSAAAVESNVLGAGAAARTGSG